MPECRPRLAGANVLGVGGARISSRRPRALGDGYAASVRRVLLTGMSGTGKSTLVNKLAPLGHKAIDLDDPDWSEMVNDPSAPGVSASAPGQDWQWREDRLERLLVTEDAEVLFVSGCTSNQIKFYPRFDHIVLLSAPISVMVERLATRTANLYGKRPDELAMVLDYSRTVEPLLRRAATFEVDTSAPLDEVVAAVLEGAAPIGVVSTMPAPSVGSATS